MVWADRGSLLVPVGEFAELARRRPLSTDTRDLSASLRSNRRCGDVGRVLNLYDGGMLLESSSDLDVAQTVGFELVGPGFRYAGLASVVHRQDGAIGLRFLGRDGPVERPVGALVAARLRGQQLGSHDPGKAGITPPTMSDSRGHHRATVSGLSALIEASPGAVARRHQVLNVSEQGMLIDGLAPLVGARISFVLAGRSISHVGCDRVAHRTDTNAGGCGRSLARRAGSHPRSNHGREQATPAASGCLHHRLGPEVAVMPAGGMYLDCPPCGLGIAQTAPSRPFIHSPRCLGRARTRVELFASTLQAEQFGHPRDARSWRRGRVLLYVWLRGQTWPRGVATRRSRGVRS